MGWWKLRTQQETLDHLNRHVCAARIGLVSGNLEFIDGKEVSRLLISDLPFKMEGKDSLSKNSIMQMLEDAIPGISNALYVWFEPQSRGGLIGEMLSSWPGGARRHAAEKPEKDT